MGKVVTFGEIMLRLSTPGYERFVQSSSFDISFGGGEANVALSLACFGIRVDFVSRLPENDLGELCLMSLRRHNVGTDYIIRGGDRLGIYFLETGAVTRPSRVIYDRSDSSMATIRPGMINWKKAFKEAEWFHWTGITPAISESAAEACLEGINAAKKMGLTVSVDLNYRKNLWKYGKQASEVMPDMVKHCDIILGNEEDAEKVFGITAEGTDLSKGKINNKSYLSVCKKLATKFKGVSKIIITLRRSLNANHNKWSGLLWDRREIYTSREYDITHIVDRVGSGDAFMAGIIYSMLTRSGDYRYAIEFAAAASCLKHTIPGDFNIVSVAEVETLMSGDSSGRVSR